MADRYNGVPEVNPANAPAVFQTGAGATPDAFGMAEARAKQALGEGQKEVGAGLGALSQGAFRAADFFGQVAADESANFYADQVNKIIYGDATKMVPGPDGTMIPETGYMGLKGRAALDERPNVEKRIDDLLKESRSKLNTPGQIERFDGISRRFRAITNAEVSRYADTQYKSWASATFGAKGKLATEEIAANPDNVAVFTSASMNLIDARVDQAKMMGAKSPDDPLWKEAVSSAQRDAWTARLQAIAIDDPARARNLMRSEATQKILGPQYRVLDAQFRARADQQTGAAYTDGLIGASLPLKDGTNASEMLRQFEVFRNTAYWDVNHWRVGYGSDTITKPDGTKVEVTQNTVVTKEDAERDLARRTQESAGDARKAIGAEAWEKLDERTKASLTSISYNYGPAGFPSSVAAAARTGNKDEIAKAILGLSSHNGGINARRRAQEAANVQGKDSPDGRPSVRDQSEILIQIQNDPSLSPQEKAAATMQANRFYGAYNAQATKEQAEFKTAVQNSVSEAIQYGKESNPLPLERFVRQYGDIEGPVQYRNYVADVQYGADRHSFETMPNKAIRSTIDAQVPQPGAADFAHRMKNVDRLRDYADKLQTQRREDPGGVASRSPAVKVIQGQYDPKNPETFQPVATARLAEQERLGIEPEYRSPITKAEALQMTKPIQFALPGDKGAAVELVASQFQKMFGEFAPQAFLYAMNTLKDHGLELTDAERVVFKAMRSGAPITAADRQVETERANTVRIEEALKADKARSESWMQYDPEGNPLPKPEVGKKPTPSSSAIKDLRDNPQSAGEFDKLFGVGTAKKLMEQYPLYFNKGAPSGGR